MDSLQVTARLTIHESKLEVYGSPSDELLRATVGLAPKIYLPFQSL